MRPQFGSNIQHCYHFRCCSQPLRYHLALTSIRACEQSLWLCYTSCEVHLHRPDILTEQIKSPNGQHQSNNPYIQQSYNHLHQGLSLRISTHIIAVPCKLAYMDKPSTQTPSNPIGKGRRWPVIYQANTKLLSHTPRYLRKSRFGDKTDYVRDAVSPSAANTPFIK